MVDLHTEEKGRAKKKRSGDKMKSQDMETTVAISQSQLSSWLVGESGVNNSNPWLSTKSKKQFLVEFTHPLIT